MGAGGPTNASSSICCSIARTPWLARTAVICASIFTRPSVPVREDALVGALSTPHREIPGEIHRRRNTLQTTVFAGLLRCRRRDSNPRHADYDGSAGVVWVVAEATVWL